LGFFDGGYSQRRITVVMPPPPPPPQPQWTVGESCLAKDAGAWYPGRLIEERRGSGGKTEFKVHFMGWKARYDRWVAPDPEALLPAGSIIEQPPVAEPKKSQKPKAKPDPKTPKAQKKRRGGSSGGAPARAKARAKPATKGKKRPAATKKSATTTAVVATSPAPLKRGFGRRTGGAPGAPQKKARPSLALAAATTPATAPATLGQRLPPPANANRGARATSGKSRKTAPPVRRTLKKMSDPLLEHIDLSKVMRAELCFDALAAEELKPLLAALGWPIDGANRMDLVARLRDAVSQRLQAGGATEGAAASMSVYDARAPHIVRKKLHSLKAPTKPDDILEPVQDPTYESIAAALDSINVPVNVSRTNVKVSDDQVVTGMCIGVVGGRSHGIITSKYARQRPNLTESLVKFAKKFAPGFHFTSIQVNKNYLSAMHVDKNNLGPSFIVGVGDYKDGALWVQPEGDVDCRHKWVLFDGNIPHCTLPYTGTRYTLIYFSQQSFRLLGHVGNNRSHKATLMQLGFPFPPRSAKKMQYEPWKVRLLQAKAAFRKWEDCKTKGIDYTWNNKERAKWRHESDDEDPALNEKNDDGWGPDDSDSEDEPDSWVVRGRRRGQLFAGAPVPSSLIRQLGRTGGVSVLAQNFIRKARGQTFNLRERSVGTTYIDRASDDEDGWSDMDNNYYMGPRASRGDGMERSGKRRVSEQEWMEGIVAQPHFGHCVHETHEPSMQDIASQLGVRVQHLVGLNKAWYPRLSYFARLVKGTMLLIPDTPGAVRGCIPLHHSWTETREDAYRAGEESWGMYRPRSSASALAAASADGRSDSGPPPAALDTSPVEAKRWLRRMYRTGGVKILGVREEEAEVVSSLLTSAKATASAAYAACMERDKVENEEKRQRKRKLSEAAEATRAAKRARQEERADAKIQREIQREVAAVLKQLVLTVHRDDAAEKRAAKEADAAEKRAARDAERAAKEALRVRMARAPMLYRKNLLPNAYKKVLLMDAQHLMRGCKPYCPPKPVKPPPPIVYKKSLLQDCASVLWRGCRSRPRLYKHNKRKREKGEPRGPVSAYLYFCTAAKPALLAEQPSLLPSDRSKALSDRWRNMDTLAREPYVQLHRADHERYRREITAWDLPEARVARQAAAEAARLAAEEAIKAAKAKEEERKRLADDNAAAAQAAAAAAALMPAAVGSSSASKAGSGASGGRKRRKKEEGEPMGYRSAYLLYAADSKVQAAATKQAGAALIDRSKMIGLRWQNLSARSKASWNKKAAADKLRFTTEMAAWQAAKEAEAARAEQQQLYRNSSSYIVADHGTI
jgi:hypothetical protein